MLRQYQVSWFDLLSIARGDFLLLTARLARVWPETSLDIHLVGYRRSKPSSNQWLWCGWVALSWQQFNLKKKARRIGFIQISLNNCKHHSRVLALVPHTKSTHRHVERRKKTQNIHSISFIPLDGGRAVELPMSGWLASVVNTKGSKVG